MQTITSGCGKNWNMKHSQNILTNYYYLESAVQAGSENTLSVQKPQSHTTNPWKEEGKIVGDKKEKADHVNRRALASSALETRQSHTIQHRVTKIVPKRHREGHKGSAILRSPTTRRRERVPMSNQSTRSNTCRHIWQRQCTLKGCIGLLLILNSMHNSATDRRWARLQSKTPTALFYQHCWQLCPVVVRRQGEGGG